MCPQTQPPSPPPFPLPQVLNRNDLTFFFGDLNYRVQPLENLEDRPAMHAIVRGHISNQEWDTLLGFDQLRAQQRARVAFHQFDEAKIDFPPTFKVVPGETSDDPAVLYNAKRVPSYCDRVLWRALPHCRVRCESYRSHPEVTSSDHIPVTAALRVELPQVHKDSKVGELKVRSGRWVVACTLAVAPPS